MNLRSTLKVHDEKSTAPGRVLVVDDHQQARESVAFTLRQSGYAVQCCSSAVEALKRQEREQFDVVVTDLKMPGMTGLEFLAELKRRKAPLEVILVTAYATVATAVEAMRQGAFDFLEKPFNVEALEDLVGRAMRHRTVAAAGLALATVDDAAGPVMIGSSPQMQALRMRIARAAPTNETVLITGESGTGKELVAGTVHALGSRATKPLVSLNCPALSSHLMESELFGHERGAFTGAETRRSGRFEAAHMGSILLDEITELELPLQAKLLRVLQERRFERVGSSETIDVDVRVLATTNRDLRRETAEGRFREDLYYRLAVIPLHVPALRERAGDVPELLDYFLGQAAGRAGCEPCTLSPGARDMLLAYRWPGNVRELQNLMTRAVVLNGGNSISADELRPWLIAGDGAGSSHDAASPAPIGLSLHEMERRLIEATLERYDGHRAKTAEALGIGLRTLTAKIKEYGYPSGAKRLAAAG
ncbi:MAG: sigma-54 dependent transcriptional regulator [Planctomycetia bacterium]|nr:sigma-54 dependent transcriptional regulator [Planctomycetia bacterium]